MPRATGRLERSRQVAGLSTKTKGSFELLCHAVSQPAPAVIIAKAGR